MLQSQLSDQEFYDDFLSLFLGKDIAFEAPFRNEGMDIYLVAHKLATALSTSDDTAGDIAKMVTLICERGTNLTKMVNTMGHRGKEEVLRLKTHYSLKDRVTTSDPNCLTLARVGMLYPSICAAYVASSHCKNRPVAISTMSKWSSNYPKCMMTTAFSSLLLDPNDMQDEASAAMAEKLTLAFIAYLIEFSKHVSIRDSTKRNWTDKKWKEEALKYATADRSSGFFLATWKIRELKSLGVLKNDETLGACILEAASKISALT